MFWADNRDLKAAGQRIRHARERLGLTQDEVAKALGKTSQAISSYEKGDRAVPFSDIPELTKKLQVDIRYLFGVEIPREELLPDLAKINNLSEENRRIVIELAKVVLDYYLKLENSGQAQTNLPGGQE